MNSYKQRLTIRLLRKKQPLDCVACGSPVLIAGFDGNTHLDCPTCGAHLELTLKYNWLYTSICIAAGLSIASVQGLSNPLFIMCALIYSGALVVIAAPVLAPFFRLRLKRARGDYIPRLEFH